MNRNQAGFSREGLPSRISTETVSGDHVRSWFADPVAVEHYARAATNLGLWRSETIVLTQVFARSDRLLDIGCGTGRITFGLGQLGYENLTAIDFCPEMIAAAQQVPAAGRHSIRFAIGDATALEQADASFDGVVFGFNGLMQIPRRERRRQALLELRRVVRAGGRIVFTTHDRNFEFARAEWEEERMRWAAGQISEGLIEFGDRILQRPEGRIFMHLPDRDEVLADLASTGWSHDYDERRSRIANESPAVRDFSDECRFWVATAG